jgi:NADPH:quinone reductase-like Zn-dependent oxidoreductase
MKAALHSRGIIQVTEIAPPVPKDGEVLVRVHASTVSAADYRIGSALRTMLGRGVLRLLKKPVALGMEFAGTVESTGGSVTSFRPGDLVFGGSSKFGAHAEFVCVPESKLALKPSNMPLEQAAAVMFGGLTALAFLREAGIRSGQNVLVYGASGSVGVFAVQLAKHFGARVTGVCSTANLQTVRSLGADAVVDYTQQDFSSTGRVYDMIFDTVGYSGFSRSLRALKRGGPYVRIAPSGGLRWGPFLLSMLGDSLRQAWISLTGSAKIFGGVPKIAAGDLAVLKELIEAGELKTLIDRQYPLAQIGDAFRYAGMGHKKGHVVILIADAPGRLPSARDEVQRQQQHPADQHKA